MNAKEVLSFFIKVLKIPKVFLSGNNREMSKPKKFKYGPLQNRRYKLGKDQKEGDRVWFRRSGAHYDLLGVVVDGKIIVQNHHAIPEYLISAFFGLWPNHKYLIATV